MDNRKFILGIGLASLMGGVFAIGGYKLLGEPQNQVTYQTVQQNIPANFSANQGTQNTPNFIASASIARPAVVHIKTYKTVQQYQTPGYYQDFFRDFFGNPYQQHNQPQQQQPQNNTKEKPAGSGSGVIIRDDGYIVTNNHVVHQADKIEVVLDDKRRYEATLVGTDPTTDLAVLKIEETSLPKLTFGDSDELQVGEWVLAVGNPFDLTSTVTAGIVSAKARSINILRGKTNMAIESFIQTDAAVNPGNSGGALVDTKGKLVGINTAIATPTGTFAGYSFAVPSILVRKVVDDLIEYGQVQRALLGISIVDITAELAEEKGLKKVEGVYVADVREGGAASDAGLKSDDVILKINNTKVNSSSELQEIVGRNRPGDKVKITYLRDGKEKTTEAILKNKLNTTKVVKKDDKPILHLMGAKLQEISDKEKKKMGLEHGVKVVSLEDGKFKSAGVKKDFVITHVNNRRIATIDELKHYLQNKTRGLLVEGTYPNGQRVLYALGL
ncbi:MAG: Do family serine endopeptidase [Cytophagales bacterium]|nr:Do family serine endopeptidase [Cytophagales bacterium]